MSDIFSVTFLDYEHLMHAITAIGYFMKDYVIVT